MHLGHTYGAAGNRQRHLFLLKPLRRGIIIFHRLECVLYANLVRERNIIILKCYLTR